MNNSKKINVNFSSLVGLKAELLRKQTEVNEAKLRTEAIRTVPKLKKRPKKAKEERDTEGSEKPKDIDDINAHKKSKLMLEAKARLYERLKKSKNNNVNFLVDFTNKSDESEVESLTDEANDDTIFENEDDWVEYQDCFGRTRKCLREDLPVMQEKDELVKQQVMNRKYNGARGDNSVEESPVVEEKEPEIEIMRRKWEEQTQKLADKANIHYQDVLFDEARTHGVGYYAFSQDEKERIKQQENLANLRKDTEKKQKEMKELKELRDRMELNRLKAARIRQRIRAGLPAEPTEEELQPKTSDVPESDKKTSDDSSDKNDAKDNSVPEVSEKKEDEKESDRSEDPVVVKEDKIRALGELLGKRTNWYEMSQEEWVHKCRKKRVDEFGPVYNNFKRGGYLSPESTSRRSSGDEDDRKQESDTQEDYKDESSEVHNVEVNLDSILLPPSSPKQPLSKPTVEESDASNANLERYSPSFESPEREQRTDFVPEDSAVNASIATTSSTVQNSAIVRNINEETIAAGLKYLREKFEKGENI